jgi:phage gp36-like protein
MTAAPSYLYTSWTEIAQLYSTTGQSAITSDVTGGDLTSVQTDTIASATDEVLMHLGMEYNQEDMYTSSIVRRICTTIACYFLSQRRANPSLFQTRYDNAVSRLQSLRDGTLSLPGVRRLKDSLPSMSNYNFGGRHPINKIRTGHDSYLPDNSPNEAPNIPQWPYQ